MNKENIRNYYNDDRLFNLENNEDVFTKSREQIEKEYKINPSTFNNYVKKISTEIGIDINTIRITKGGRYHIPILTEPLFEIMINNCTKNPIYKNKEISFEEILKYNEEIFEKIDKLPTELKYYIKNTKSYKYNINVNTLIPILIERLEYLFELVLNEDCIENGNGLVSLIKSIDDWIYIIKEDQYTKNSIIGTDFKDMINSEKDSTNSIIDSAIKSCYNNQVGLFKKVEEKLYKEKGKTIKIDEINRENIIKFIYSGEDLKSAFKFTKDNLKEKEVLINKKLRQKEREYKKDIEVYNRLRLKNRIKNKKKRIDENPITPKKLEKVNNKVKKYIEDIISKEGRLKQDNNYINKCCMDIYIMLQEEGIDNDLLISKASKLYSDLKGIMYNIERKKEYNKIEIDLKDTFKNYVSEEEKTKLKIFDDIIKDLDNREIYIKTANENKYMNLVIGESLKKLYDKDKLYLRNNKYGIDEIEYK